MRVIAFLSVCMMMSVMMRVWLLVLDDTAYELHCACIGSAKGIKDVYEVIEVPSSTILQYLNCSVKLRDKS